VSRPAAPEPRPGFALFLGAFLLSPLALVCWAAAQGVLKVTGWPRWRVGAAAVAGGAAVIWLQGGPVPALAAHFSGYLGLLSQFGAPVVHLPAPGRSWSRRSPSVSPPVAWPPASPGGPTWPCPTRPPRPGRPPRATRSAAGPTPGRACSLLGNEQRPRGLARRRSGLLASRQVRGATRSRGPAAPPRARPPRAGQERLPALAGFAARQGIILDGKGDADFTAAVVDAYLAGWQAAGHPGVPSVHLFPDEPLSAWQGSPAEQVNKLLGTWAWSLESQWYKELCVLALRLACGQPGPPVTGMGELIARLDPSALARAGPSIPPRPAWSRRSRTSSAVSRSASPTSARRPVAAGWHPGHRGQRPVRHQPAHHGEPG
jgi:hypothetical protein